MRRSVFVLALLALALAIVGVSCTDDEAEKELRRAEAEIQGLEIKLRSAEADLDTAQTDLGAARSDLDAAQANLEQEQTSAADLQATIDELTAPAPLLTPMALAEAYAQALNAGGLGALSAILTDDTVFIQGPGPGGEFETTTGIAGHLALVAGQIEVTSIVV